MTASSLFGPATPYQTWRKYESVQRAPAFSQTLVQEGILQSQHLLAAIRAEATPGAQEGGLLRRHGRTAAELWLQRRLMADANQRPLALTADRFIVVAFDQETLRQQWLRPLKAGPSLPTELRKGLR